MTWAECSSKINSFLSHLNTKLRLLPVFRLKLHWLSGGGAQMDLLQIWCMERSQWPDKQLRSQSAARVVRRSGGQFSALIAKSCEQVGGWRLESCCAGAAASLRGLAGRHCIRGQGPDTTLVLLLRYNLKAPHQHRTSGHQAKECLPSCCHQQLPKVVTASSCQAVKVVPGSPFRTSLVAHLSSCCQSQDLALVIAAETFEKK